MAVLHRFYCISSLQVSVLVAPCWFLCCDNILQTHQPTEETENGENQLITIVQCIYFLLHLYHARPRSAVVNVSSYRCVSDCRSRGCEFDPGPVPYFRGDWLCNHFYSHSPPFSWFIQEVLVSVTSESMCTNYWLTACSSLPRKKCGKVNWPSRHDHSCWLGT